MCLTISSREHSSFFLQSSFQRTRGPHDEYVAEILLFVGKAFSQSTTKYMNSIFSLRGMNSNGSMPTMPRKHSMIVRMERSALLMCSFATVVLHTTSGNSFFTFSNHRPLKCHAH